MWMADGRRRHEWTMTARLCVAAANSNPYRKRSAKEEHYNPYMSQAAPKPKREYVKGSIHALKVFLPKKPRKKKPCPHPPSEPAPPTSS
jgi:hypothetical protein